MCSCWGNFDLPVNDIIRVREIARFSLGQTGKKLDFEGNKRLLDGLARELRQSLTFIARQAEYQSGKNRTDLAAIEKSASDSLKLIDSYLLCARTEYGQQLLPMEPVGPGAVLQEAAEYMPQPVKRVVRADYREPVMANKQALAAALWSLSKIIVSAKSKGKEIYLVSQRGQRSGLALGVFAKGFSAKPSEIQRSAELLGTADMSLANQTFASGVDLAIASQLAASMGGQVFAGKYKGRGGLCLSLLKSDQLSLVGK